MRRLPFHSALFALLVVAPLTAWGQVGAPDRDEIVRLAQSRGASEADVAPLLDEAARAAERGLPLTPLLNKVREGLSKGHPPARVHGVVKELVGHLDTARGLLAGTGDDAARMRATVVLAEALGRGVTRDEFGELRRLAEDGRRQIPPERLAVGARFWSLLKEGGFSDAALGLVAETVRQDYRASDLAALARDMVARREDLASVERLDALRDAVRRGERPERLVPTRDATRTIERPRAEPQCTPDRPQRERPAK